MSPPPPGESRYQIHHSRSVGQLLRDLHHRAIQAGLGEAFLAALKQVVERIRANPDDVGEPLYRLPVLRMRVCCAVIRPLAVDFAVCEDRPVVIIKGARLI